MAATFDHREDRSANLESVWDYPRPPRLERSESRLVVVCAGLTIADTTRAFRMLETSHPPTYYFPPEDVQVDLLEPSLRRTICEWKGQATYWSLQLHDAIFPEIAWSYRAPRTPYDDIMAYLAFYPGRVDACTVDGEAVERQESDFYGGWITSNIRGPFKGRPGTEGW